MVVQDLLAAEVDLGEGVMIEEEDMIVDMPLEADIVEDTEVDLGATLHTERSKGRRDSHWLYSISNERKDLKKKEHPQDHRSRRRIP